MAGALRRGDIITVAAPGDYGKPRPAVVIQSDWITVTNSVLVCLMTGALRDGPYLRLTVDPRPETGLMIRSQIMVDKIIAIPRRKCGAVIGRLDQDAVTALNHVLSVTLGLAD